MSQAMGFEDTGPRESLTTVCTHMRFLSCVDELVLPQSRSMVESLVTIRTHVRWCLFRVDKGTVFLEIGGMDKAFPTVRARMRLLSRESHIVGHHVSSQM